MTIGTVLSCGYSGCLLRMASRKVLNTRNLFRHDEALTLGRIYVHALDCCLQRNVNAGKDIGTCIRYMSAKKHEGCVQENDMNTK